MSCGLTSTHDAYESDRSGLVRLVGQGIQSKSIHQSCVWEKYETLLKSASFNASEAQQAPRVLVPKATSLGTAVFKAISV